MKRTVNNIDRVAIFSKNSGKSISNADQEPISYPVSAGIYAGLDTTTIWVNQHEFIAPMGGSGGSNYSNNDPFDVHLHLYRLDENPGDNAASSHHLCKDPSRHLDVYEATQYSVSLSHPQIFPVYSASGTNESSLRVRVDMENASQIGERFNNVLMKAIETKVYISEGTGSFDTIVGPTFTSYFDLDNLFPNRISVDGNNSRGSYQKTGLYPGAYSGLTYDDYYFSDFVTRIHQDDPMGGGQAQIANCPDNARYPDGRYQIYAEVTDVRNSTFSSDTLSFILDNWKPYVKDVSVQINNTEVYHEEWECNGNCIDLSENDLAPVLTADDLSGDVIVTVIPSEAIIDFRFTIPAIGVDTFTLIPNADSTQYTYTFQSAQTVLIGTDFVMHFIGNDLSGNDLISLDDPLACVQVPFRNSATAFTDNNTPKLSVCGK